MSYSRFSLIRLEKTLLLVLLITGNLVFGHHAAATEDAGTTKLPSIFGNNMVLQREAVVKVWGWDKPGTEVVLAPSWGSEVKARANDSGYWEAGIQTLGAGGPYELLIQGSDQIKYDNILFGEVWLCSGQSNMEMPVKGFPNQPIVNSREEILKADKPEIRFFIVPRQSTAHRHTDLTGEWIVCSPEFIGEFSAVGYFFGSELYENLDVPIGLIGSYWGGTSAEIWTDTDVLKANFADKDLASPPEDHPQPGSLYKEMIHPIIPFTIKGAIWYQGESNRSRSHLYDKLFSAMVEDWRLKWGQGDFPFYFVQIAPFKYDGADKISSALLREAQLKASQSIPNSGMVVSLDHGNFDIIHPFNKKPIGDRLAYWALNKQYGYDYLLPEGPVYKEMKIEGNTATLFFDNIPNGLIYMKAELDEFEMAGSDKVFHPAKAVVTRESTVQVSSPEVDEPVAVRYAFRNYPKATLLNTEGLPASSFRTDDW